MQLKYNRHKFWEFFIKTLIRLIVVIIFFIIAIFLIEKLISLAPKNYDIDVTNDIKSFKILFGLSIIFLFSSHLQSEDKIDIWKIRIKREKFKQKI